MSFSLYGLFVGIAVAVVLWRTDRLLPKVSSGSEGVRTVFVLLGALAGGRLYHLATDWSLYQTASLLDLVAVWNGGLGIFGALLGGAAGLFCWKIIAARSVPFLLLLDAFAIAAPLGQAIGRWGNFFNQELFGPPTTLPWGIFIAPPHRPAEYASAPHFHPVFLYESLLLLLMAFGLQLIFRNSTKLQSVWPNLKLGSGLYSGLYLMGYGLIRFPLEYLRIETAAGPLGLSIAQWVSLAALILGLGLQALSLRASQKFLVSLCLIGSCALLRPQPISAQQLTPFDLSLSPSVVEIAVQPGKLVTQAFLIENSGTTDLEITATLRDFVSEGNSGHASLQETSTFPYAGLQNADRKLEEPFLLPANSSQQLVLGIDVPAAAQERDWYTAVLVQTKPAQESLPGQSAAYPTGHIASLLLIRVTKENTLPLNWELQLSRLPRFTDSLQSISFQALVKNLSTTYATPDLHISILDWKRNVVFEAEGLPDRVLAQTQREILQAEKRTDDPRSLQGVPFVFDPLFAFGPYTVRATIRNDIDGPVVVEETVHAYPFSLAIAGTALLLLLLGIRKLKKRETLRSPK